MAELFQTPLSTTERFASDYLHTFARLLDPNLPPTTILSTDENERARWPLGQKIAFATIAALSMWALLAGIFRYLA